MSNVTTTTLRMKVEDREALKLKQTLTDVFSPKGAKELKAATRDLERQFSSAAKAQASLLKQLGSVDKGTKAYKALGDELKTVRDRADLVQKSLSQIDAVYARTARTAREGKGRNFGLGLAQGAGVAQYLPSGPGDGSRLAGASIAGAARRIGGSVAAPFMTPGIGGLARGLSGIPLVGGFAAGAMGTAASAYQSAVGFDRARHQNLYFANENFGRIKRYGPGQKAMQRLSAAESAVESAQQGLGPRATVVRAAGQAALQQLENSNAGAEGSHGRPTIAQQREMNRKLGMGQIRGRVGSLAGRLVTGGGVIRRRSHEEASKLDDLIRRQQTVAVELDRTRSAKELALAKAGARGRSARISGLGGLNLGTSLGFGPMQAESMKGEMFGAQGGRFNRGGFNEAMAAKVRYGVSMTQAGQFGRMGGAGGGGTGSTGLASILQGAFVQGLRGSQVTEYLATLVGLGTDAEKKGIKINVAEFQKTTMGLRAAGIQGLQGQRIAGGLTSAAQGVSQRGVQSPVDMLMMRAAGFRPGQGLEGYALAKRKLESPTQEIFNNLLGYISGGTSGYGPEGQAMLGKDLLGKLGVHVGAAQAGKIIGQHQNGNTPNYNELLQQTAAMGGASGMVGSARGMVKTGASRTITAAGLEAQRIGVGQGMGWVAKFEANQMRAANVMRHFGTSLGKLNAIIARAIEAVDAAAQGKGGVATNLAGRLYLDYYDVKIPTVDLGK